MVFMAFTKLAWYTQPVASYYQIKVIYKFIATAYGKHLVNTEDFW